MEKLNDIHKNLVVGLIEKIISQLKDLPKGDKIIGFGFVVLLIFCLIFREAISSLPSIQLLMIPLGIILAIILRIVFGSIRDKKPKKRKKVKKKIN